MAKATKTFIEKVRREKDHEAYWDDLMNGGLAYSGGEDVRQIALPVMAGRTT